MHPEAFSLSLLQIASISDFLVSVADSLACNFCCKGFLMLVILVLVLGLVVLTAGAELLVRGASRLAVAVGIPPLVVGLTVVAFGTSAPELVVCIRSTLVGQPDLALGNVVGSNILNVLLILGISALIIPLRVSQQLIRFDVPLLVAVSILVMAFAYDGRIGRLDGLLLTIGLGSYMLWTVVKGRRESSQAASQKDAAPDPENRSSTRERVAIGRIALDVVLLVVGLLLLVLGSRWFTDSAVAIARELNVPELVIGLTIVAVGTSLPEVATSVMAAIRGERDIAVGNVVGSNLLNLLGVLGLSSLLSTDGVAVSEEAFRVDIPVMIAVAVACLPIFFTGHLIARWEGGLFFGYYCAYTGFVVVGVMVPEMVRTFATGMFGFVIPLTVITLAIGVGRSVRVGRYAD